MLDEADRMLDMGFIHDIRKIITMLPAVRQNLFSLRRCLLISPNWLLQFYEDPIRIEVVPESTPIERIEQSVYKIDKKKRALLKALL